MKSVPENRQIAIDAQLLPGGQMGGVKTQLAALVWALGQLDGPERYVLVCLPENPDWLKEYVGYNQRVVFGSSRNVRRVVSGVLGRFWPRVSKIGQRVWTRVAQSVGSHRVPPGWAWESNGFFEGLGVALVHVFYQKYVCTELPVVFNPHDLQHEHFPQFFAPEVLSRRKFVYESACRTAAAVVAASRYTRDDVIERYRIPPERIWTFPLGPATAAYELVTDDDCQEVAREYDLQKPFALYPAVTWEHKNHLRLLKAIVRLCEDGLPVNLVCTGAQRDPTWSRICRYISEHQLDHQVRFLGFVPIKHLQALYRLCQFVIAPSLFEQTSGPMFEAWQAGIPVAASNVTSVPDQAGDAALLFDPFSVVAIVDALRRMSTDAVLRAELAQRGRRRLKDFSWERTAKAYRALYRHVAGWPMTEEDHFLLGWDWMRDPRRSEPGLPDTTCQ
ncbi:MAG: glycosyltransferase family 4 protein [Planctomycetota bacterium]|jgi:glycosyltransferase involved in cell wall biosynthesis